MILNKKSLLWFFLVFLIPSFGRADFSFYWRGGNYFLSEYRNFDTLDLDKDSPADTVGNVRTFSTLKLRMKPSLSITDRVSFHSTFDVFGNPFTSHAQEGGALQGTQATDTLVYGPTVHANLPRALFGGLSGYGRSALTSTSNFLVKEGYLEYIGDWGILKIGRIPRQWGLGIRYDSGEKIHDKFSDRTDSIFYEMGLGNFKLAGIYSKIVEGGLDSNSDDVTLWEGSLHWNHPEKDIDVGLLYSYMKNSSNFIKLHFFDAYATKKYSKWSVGLEGVVTRGEPGNISENNAEQLGVAAELNYDWMASLKTYLKTGYASGADLGKPTTLTLYTFNRNYDIALIMFNQGIGAIPAQTGISAASNPDANAISNAVYMNTGAQYHFNDRIGSNLSYTVSEAPLSLTFGGEKFYGQEVDVSAWYQFLENLKFSAAGGVFFPGDLYSGKPQQSPLRSTDVAYAGFAAAILLF